MPEPKLLLHMPLDSNAQDAAGQTNGEPINVTFGQAEECPRGKGAFFNGRDAMIQVPDSMALRFGHDDFSVSVWVQCEDPVRGVTGDILSKFDPGQRCGINFQISGSSPAYNGMSDSRYVHFGIDDGDLGTWTDCGKPWLSNTNVTCLLVYEGELYCGIADADNPMDATKIFRWKGSQEWVDCGRLGKDQDHLSVMSMLVHDGKMFAGTGVYDWVRSAGVDFEPALSRVFVYEGGTEWRDLGQVGESVRVLCLCSFDGELYAGLDREGGGHIYKYDGSAWVDWGAPNGNNVQSLLGHAGTLFGCTHGIIYRYEGGQEWTCIGDRPFENTQIHCMQTIGGKLHIGTWPQGYVLRYEGGEEWSNIGRLGLREGMFECNEINDLTIYNGKLYAGVIPKAQVYRYESDGHWSLLGTLANHPDYIDNNVDTWSRVTSLTLHKGNLFASTSSCKGRAIDRDPDETLGRVHAFQTGQVVSHERDLGSAWTHLAAVREGRELHLYVNGDLSSTSRAPAGKTFDLSNNQPMTIGFGSQDYFSGSMADLRFYSGAIDEKQVKALGS